MTDNWNAWQQSVAQQQEATATAQAAAKAAAKAAAAAERAERIELLTARIKVLDDLYQGSRRTQYRKERDLLGKELDGLMREQLATDETSTPLDKLLELILLKEQDYDKTGNILDKDVIERLKVHAAEHFDANGQELPPQQSSAVLTMQLSPDEALTAEGWWNIQPTGYGRVPWWISNVLPDPSAGLDVSLRRSNGCMQVKNQVETADRWINDAEAVANQYGSSVRLIRMAGYAMAGRWYLLPTSNIQGAGRYSFEGYAVQPAVPFNAAEEALWIDNWYRSHGSGGIISAAAAGAKWMAFDVYAKDGSTRQLVDLAKRHKLFVVANYPNLVVPAMMAHYNSAQFKVNEWRVALHMAHEIDQGRKLPVPGYEKVTSSGGDWHAWYQANGEDSNTTRTPKFNPGNTV